MYAGEDSNVYLYVVSRAQTAVYDLKTSSKVLGPSLRCTSKPSFASYLKCLLQCELSDAGHA